MTSIADQLERSTDEMDFWLESLLNSGMLIHPTDINSQITTYLCEVKLLISRYRELANDKSEEEADNSQRSERVLLELGFKPSTAKMIAKHLPPKEEASSSQRGVNVKDCDLCGSIERVYYLGSKGLYVCQRCKKEEGSK